MRLSLLLCGVGVMAAVVHRDEFPRHESHSRHTITERATSTHHHSKETKTHSGKPRKGTNTHTGKHSVAVATGIAASGDEFSMSTEVPPSSVNTGAVTISATPPACTASSVPYTTSVWVKTNQMYMHDQALWWIGKDGAKWTFTTDTDGVYFTNPYYSGEGSAGSSGQIDILPRTKANSFSLNMSEASAPSNSEFMWEIGKSNDSQIHEKTWNASRVDTQGQDYPPLVEFHLHIQGEMMCAHPVGNSTCSNNQLQLNADMWDAYGVDTWFQEWYNNNSANFGSSGGVQQVFSKQFNISNSLCELQDRCSLIQRCDELEISDQLEAGRVYMVWVSLQNLSDLFHNIFESLQTSEVDTLTQVGKLAIDFYTINAEVVAPKQNPPASQVSGIFGIFSSIAGAIAKVPQFHQVAGVAEGIFNVGSSIADYVAQNSQSSQQTVMPDSQYATNAADAASYLGNYTAQLQKTLYSLYDDIFKPGTNIAKIFQNGAFVDRELLKLDDTNTISDSQLWLENYMRLKIINSIWVQQNAFIAYVPYGNVKQVDKDYLTTFDYGNCLQFNPGNLAKICYVPGGNFNFGPLEQPGMALLSFYDPNSPNQQKGTDNKNDAHPYGLLDLNIMLASSNAYGDWSNESWPIPGGDKYAFDVKDAIQSSVDGFVKGGFNFDGIDNSSMSAASDIGPYVAIEQMQYISTLKPSAPGVFNIPVCLIKDLNMLPSIYGQGGRDGTYVYSICADFADLHGKKFKDSVTDSLKSLVTEIQMTDGKSMAVGAPKPGGDLPTKMGP